MRRALYEVKKKKKTIRVMFKSFSFKLLLITRKIPDCHIVVFSVFSSPIKFTFKLLDLKVFRLCVLPYGGNVHAYLL